MNKMVTLKNIQQAQKTIAPYAKPTPLTRSKFLSELCSDDVFLKLENQQVTHSFKIRGVINKLLNLSPEEKARGVVTASAGNHGQAVAFGAQKLGFSAKIVVPTNTPKIKVDGIKQYGADLLLFGETYSETEKKAKEIATQEGCFYISPYNDELIVAGHGTVGLEILKALPTVDVVIVPVGGGGLISGISIAVKSLKPNVQVIGVQSEASPIMYESLKAGKIVPPHRHEPYTVAEGLSGGIEKGSITFTIAQQYVDEVMLVREESIRHAVYLLWKNEKQVVEGSGVAGVAMLLENNDSFTGQTVAVVITGGNIDDSLFKSILASEE
ncbi:pyridoxal-phosphate dependent enzyme [Candidatus Bathyarchaeota archaeon]|nr:pyridoxal-phosphate dependent enzyme [Candidatus Bathyarchaeota archaeon]